MKAPKSELKLRASKPTIFIVALAHMVALVSVVLLIRSQTANAASTKVPAHLICSGTYNPPTISIKRSVRYFFNHFDSEIREKMDITCANAEAADALTIADRYADACHKAADNHISSDLTGQAAIKQDLYKKEVLAQCQVNRALMLAYIQGAAVGMNPAEITASKSRLPASSAKAKVSKSAPAKSVKKKK